MKEIKIVSVGKVVQTEDGFAIKLEEEYKAALLGLKGFSHLNILWWADGVDEDEMRAIRTVDKPYKTGPDKLGIFATRSPLRPNPICMTIVYVTGIDYEKGMVYTPYIDANPDTQVLDIKIYLPCSDFPENHFLPEWAQAFPKNIEAAAEFDWSTVFNFDY